MDNLTFRGLPAALVKARCAPAIGGDRVSSLATPRTSAKRTLVVTLLALLIGAGTVLAAQRLVIGQQGITSAPEPVLVPAPLGVGALGRVEPASRVRRPSDRVAIKRTWPLCFTEPMLLTTQPPERGSQPFLTA